MTLRIARINLATARMDQGNSDAASAPISTPLGHTVSVHKNVSQEDWDDASKRSLKCGGKTMMLFNHDADRIARENICPQIDLSIHISGKCMTLKEGGAYYFHAVQCCLVGVLERGSRFSQKPNGSISFRIDATDWDLGLAGVHLHPAMTNCGVYSVLVSFDMHCKE